MSHAGDEADVQAQAIASLNTLRDRLLEVGNATCQVNLVKSTRAPVRKNTRYLDMTQQLAQRVKELAAATLLSTIHAALETPDGVAEFDNQAFADGRLAALPIEDYPDVVAWLAHFPASDQVDPLAATDNHVRQLKFLHTLVVFPSDGDALRLFSRSSEARAVKKGVASVLTGTRYDYVEPERLLILDVQPDFFLWDNFIFSTGYKALEAILNFREITRAQAEEVCNTVFQLLPVTNTDALREAILTGARKLNKIASLRNKPHVPLLIMNRVEQLIQEKGLPITIVEIDGVRTLSVDPADQNHVAAYIHILNDDFLRSLLTDLAYLGIEKALMPN